MPGTRPDTPRSGRPRQRIYQHVRRRPQPGRDRETTSGSDFQIHPLDHEPAYTRDRGFWFENGTVRSFLAAALLALIGTTLATQVVAGVLSYPRVQAACAAALDPEFKLAGGMVLYFFGGEAIKRAGREALELAREYGEWRRQAGRSGAHRAEEHPEDRRSGR